MGFAGDNIYESDVLYSNKLPNAEKWHSHTPQINWAQNSPLLAAMKTVR